MYLTQERQTRYIDGSIMKPKNRVYCTQCQKEQDKDVPKDLEELIVKLSKQFPDVSFAKLSRIAARVARWQKECLIKFIETKYKLTNEEIHYNGSR